MVRYFCQASFSLGTVPAKYWGHGHVFQRFIQLGHLFRRQGDFRRPQVSRMRLSFREPGMGTM